MGFFVLFWGLKYKFVDIMVIVIVVDDGGSFGCLWNELKILFFGDIRNVFVVLFDVELFVEDFF